MIGEYPKFIFSPFFNSNTIHVFQPLFFFAEIGLASVLSHSVVYNSHFLFQIKSYPLFTVEITKKSVSREIVVLYNVLHGVYRLTKS